MVVKGVPPRKGKDWSVDPQNPQKDRSAWQLAVIPSLERQRWDPQGETVNQTSQNRVLSVSPLRPCLNICSGEQRRHYMSTLGLHVDECPHMQTHIK